MVGLAVLDGVLIGRKRDMLDLYFLFASRDRRDAGIGGQLLARIVGAATGRGADKLYILAANSEHTIKFYLKHGARVAREEELSDEMIEDEANFNPELRSALGDDIHLVIEL